MPTPYQPAVGGGFGYEQQRIESDRFRVSFSGNSLTDRQTVENYLLFRAAELTVADGRDYFIVVSRDVERMDQYRTYAPPPERVPYWDPFRKTWRFRTVPGFGPGETVSYSYYEAVADIVLYRGAPPAGRADAYDARDVLATLGPKIRRPGP